MDELLVEGLLVDDELGIRQGQVLIRDQNIIGVGDYFRRPDLSFPNHLIFPGFGDIHVHLREGQEHKEDFSSGAAAALNGGVTFCLDMPNNPVSPVDAQTLEAKHRKIGEQAVQIGLYAAVGPDTEPFGHSHYKVFMAHSIGDLYFESLEAVRQTLKRYRGCRVTFHCEDPVLLESTAQASTHEDRRPPEAEASAVAVAIELARELDLQANIAHLSSAQGLELIREARRDPALAGRLTCEATPHHLFFDTENRTRFPRNEYLKMNPPLRSPEQRQALWQAFQSGTIDFLATDHAPHTVAEKEAENPSGVPHLDTYGGFVAWLLSQGIEAQHLARVCCRQPGEWFGGQVGRLRPGYRGDLAVLDVNSPWLVQAEDLKTRCGWSPFEGVTLPGRVALTVAGGRLFRQGDEIT